jgi:hypothetical protein
MDRFETDEEIVNYINGSLESIEYFEEHRLFKEERLQVDIRLLFRIRNSIEWIIRMNKA